MSDNERRLAAIMFTDMVGYTALGQRNESLSLALVEEQRKIIRPILTRHNGKEVKTMGDAFLVQFPNALDAVRCAYDIQRATREFNFSLAPEKRLHLRIGIHLGDVVESGGDISGDAVNLASRIEPLAEDGGVSLTRHVFDQVQNKFEVPFRSLGPKSLKNVSLPVEVYAMTMPWDETKTSPSSLEKVRIAVLPFANMSPDPADEYFADGLTEELIDRLCQVGGLEVIARTSVMSYKKQEKKASEIAMELKAGSIVEGSVRKAGDTIRVTAQLVNGATEGHLWSSKYDRTLNDIFAVQTEIAEQVVDALKVRLLPREKAAIQKKATENTEAYELYLQGRYYWNERTKESIERAMAYFRKALEKDPQFALAYAGLADSYTILLDRGLVAGREYQELCRKNAERALEIDPLLPEAHLAMGGMLRLKFDWTAAELEFRKSLELNPSLAQARHWLGMHYSVLDRWEESNREYAEALKLDPLSKHLAGVASYVMMMAGMLDDGMRMAEELVGKHPDAYWGHTSLSFACLKKGQFRRAIEEAKLGDDGSGHPFPMSVLLYAMKAAGRQEEAEETFKKYLATDGAKPWSPSQMAMVYVVMNRLDEAFELLGKGFRDTDPGLIYLGWPPIFDSVRLDPRYLELLRKVKPS